MISETILAFARQRGKDKTTCPSEIARALFPDNWRKYMKQVRDEAIKLHNKREVVIMQKGKVIDVQHIKGPVRIKIV
ncbi:DUF3253 domain-containing protein [Pedobacter sp.]|uniref:DUF3253 domain-containing protein n=1 Tax=Pedobacter sp. TaxID=1411316 RepID=UPI003BAB0D24